jgi:V8-like Glu-specific endopeptidase
MRKVRLLVAVVTLMLVLVAPATAITYGEPDGNRHPYVGALIAESDGELFQVCTGTLIAPDVFLTAAHCTAVLEANNWPAYVTFDSVFVPGSSTLIAGTMYTHPQFPGPMANTYDIAVVILKTPVTTVTPAQLPTAGLLDQLATKNGLKRQTFTAVGYGAQERTTGGGQPSFGPSGTRMVSTSRFNAINKSWLRLSQNPATGNGGTCYGDSGGPNFLGDTNIIAAITVTGDAVCRATNVVYRLDTDTAREFLSEFVTLP